MKVKTINMHSRDIKAFRIEKLTAYVAVDSNGEEGVMGVKTNEGWLPLVCADEARIESMYEIAKNICYKEGKEFKVLQFSVRQDVTEELNNKYGPVFRIWD